MNKNRNKLLVSLSFFMLFFTLINHSFSESTESENMKFSMNVVLPDNQFNKDVTHFDLLVQPGEKQKLEVIITNTGKATKKIRVTPTNATTNARGATDYSIKAENYEYDPTLKTSFTSLVSESQTIEVKPGKSESIFFDFEAPQNEFDGVILGGFVADFPDSEENSNTEENVMFVNKFQIVKGAIIRSSGSIDKDVIPEIKLNDVKPALYTNRTAITANLQNTTPILLGDVTVDAKITKKGDTKVLKSESRTDVGFAPNSNFDFPIMWDNDPLEAGDYTLVMKIIANSKEFSFNEEFRITKTDSTKLNNEAVDLNEPAKDYTLWIILAIVFGIIILMLLIIIAIQYKKSKTKKKRTKNKNKNKKKNKKK